MSRKRPVKVLLLDDKADQMGHFKLEAKQNRVLVKKSITNAEDGIRELKENHRLYDAVILDAYFLEHQDSSTEMSANALADTIDELQRLVHQDGRSIPHCIYTGQLDDTETAKIGKDSAVRGKSVFIKGRDQVEMFDYLKNEAEKSDDYGIKVQFNDVFETFDFGYMPEEKIPDMISILKALGNNINYNRDGAFNPLRKMYEVFVKSFYDIAYENDKHQDYVHDRLFSGLDQEVVNIKGSWFYLSGLDVKHNNTTIIQKRTEPVFPAHIKNLMSGFVDLVSTESHDYPEHVSVYAYQSAVFALLELLIWYKSFCSENFKEV